MVHVGRRVTIYDVAREAGVATSTVSRAYARPGRVHTDTAQKVFEAAKRLGYRSNRLGIQQPDGLAARDAIALVITDVTNPFYGEIIRGAYEAAREAGYRLILSHTNESPEEERRTIELELSHVDGLVIASSRMTDSALRMIAKQRPVVLLNRILPEASCLVSDNQRGMRRAIEHVGALGHERITYLAGPEISWSDGTRWRALREAATELELDVRRIGPNEPTVLAGLGAARRVAQIDATAVLAYNDALAIGVLKGLHKLGIAVPDEISVVGFDDIMFDDVIEPALTTVATPLYRMGLGGVRKCIALTHGVDPSSTPVVLPVRLVVRQSTAHRRPRRPPAAPVTTRAHGWLG